MLVAQERGLRVADLPPGHGIHYGHGLCRASYQRARRRGELHKYPRWTRTLDDVVEAWQAFRRPQFDYSAAQVAEVLGVAPRAVERALNRARNAGDERAVPARDTRFQSRRPRREGGARGWARWDLFDTDTRDEGEEAS